MAFKNLVFCFVLLIISIHGSLQDETKTQTKVEKVLIIGATGQAGSHIVKEALDRGLQVKAFSRNPSKLPEDVKDKVEAVAGDIQNYDDLVKAVRGVDAVIVVISPKSYEDTTKYMTRGVQNVIKAMKAENVKIINVLLSVFVFMPTEEIPELYRIEIVDQHSMHDALKNSDLDYIATCPPNFVKTPSNAYETKNGGMPGGNFNGGENVISLNQLAKFFIDSISDPKYYRQIVGVRNKAPRKHGVKA